MRAAITHVDRLRFRHRNGGKDKGIKTGDWDFSVKQVEAYLENDFAIKDPLHLFAGLQLVYAQREQDDNFFAAIPPIFDVDFRTGEILDIQPGSIAGNQSFNSIFRGFSPKLGLNYAVAPGAFVYTNFARSFEPPTSSDLNDLSAEGVAVNLKAAKAWTFEIGARGETERFGWDFTFYNSWISDEILTRCFEQPGAPATCDQTLAFNADNTIHRGVELGLSANVFENMFNDGDKITWDMIYNWSDFFFDDDNEFGDNRLPVIPEHVIYTALEYNHPSGFYFGPNLRYVSERNVTFDGSGGDDFIVPDYHLIGVKAGFRSEKGLSAFVDLRNLDDKAYVTTFSALPTVPLQRRGRALIPLDSPGIRPGDGFAVYAGVEYKF